MGFGVRINMIICKKGSVHSAYIARAPYVSCCYCHHSLVEFTQMSKPTVGPWNCRIFLEPSSQTPAADYHCQNWEVHITQDHCYPSLEALRQAFLDPKDWTELFNPSELWEGKAGRLLGRKFLLSHPLLLKCSSSQMPKGPDLSSTHTQTWPCLQLPCARASTHSASDRHSVISKLFSEPLQGMFNIPEFIQMEEAAKQCWKVLQKSIMHFSRKLFLKAFLLTVSSKGDNCSFQKFLCSNRDKQLRPAYGVTKCSFTFLFLPWIIPNP